MIVRIDRHQSIPGARLTVLLPYTDCYTFGSKTRRYEEMGGAEMNGFGANYHGVI